MIYKTFNALATIIWIIDILNINFLINGIHIAEFLDVTIPLNFWFWLLFWLLTPATIDNNNNKER